MSEKRKILIIGGAAVDTSCRITGETVRGDSNPGSIRNSTGGVGCNIAKNAAGMGLAPAFMTVLGDDALSEALRRDLRDSGIDCGHSLVLEGTPVCRYVSILDSRGELQVAVSDFETLSRAGSEWIQKNADYIASFPVVVLDANLSPEVLRKAAATARGKIFCDGVSVAKAGRLKEILAKIDTLKVNRAELGEVAGMPSGNGTQIREAAEHLIGLGVSRVFVTKGTEGASLFDGKSEYGVPAFPAEVKSVTGAGDAFAAALLFGTEKGFEKTDLLLLGTAASHIALRSGSAVNGEMSEEMLMQEYLKLSDRLGQSR